jgi:hypothetical protein
MRFSADTQYEYTGYSSVFNISSSRVYVVQDKVGIDSGRGTILASQVRSPMRLNSSY